MRETPFLQRAILRWPATAFSLLEAVIRELESIFLIFLNNYSYVANRRHMHGTNKGNAGGCKKTVLCALISVFMLTFTPEQEYGKVSAKKDKLQIRMNGKRISLLSCLVLWAVLSFAQSRIGFAYDAAGNRVKREIVLAVPQMMANQGAFAVGNRSFTDTMQGHSIKILSNAVEEILKISISGLQSTDRCSLAVCTYQGIVLLMEKIRGEVITINISSQPAGVYLLRITLNNHTTTWKIVKK